MAAGNQTSSERTEIIVVRHGQSEGNRDQRFGGHGPTPLTELGRRQAQATADALSNSGAATVVVSSDLTRAKQTAEPIARAAGVELVFDEGLRERSLGIFDDLLFSEVQQRYPQGWSRLVGRDLDYVPEGGEPIDSVFERVGSAIDRIVATNKGARVVVVSHGLAIFHAFAHICGLGSPANGLRVFTLVDNCSMSTFIHHDKFWRIVALNERGHLDGLATE